MLSKSLIQFSVDGWGCVPSLLFDMRPNYGGGNEDNGDLLQKIPRMHCHTQCPQPAADVNPCLCQRLLDTHGQVCVSLLWDHCSFLSGPGVHKVLFMPSKSLFPQSCVKFCNQITLSSKVKFPGGSQFLCQTPRLGNMLWVLELS